MLLYATLVKVAMDEDAYSAEIPLLRASLLAGQVAAKADLYRLQSALCALDSLSDAATVLGGADGIDGGASEAHSPAEADAPPAVAPQAGASTARPNRVPAADERAFSSLDNALIVVPGLFHLCKQGLLKAVWKIYWHTLLAPLAQVWPNRSRVTVKCENFARCRETFYHAQRALWLGYLAKFDETRPPITPGADPRAQRDAYVRDFVAWLREQMATGDEVFRHYLGFVLGPGHLFRLMESALRIQDVQFAIALLLPVLGLYKLTSKHNLAKQTFFFLLQLMTVDENTACRIMANLCRWESDRFGHAIPTDEVLEVRVGRVKCNVGHVSASARSASLRHARTPCSARRESSHRVVAVVGCVLISRAPPPRIASTRAEFHDGAARRHLGHDRLLDARLLRLRREARPAEGRRECCSGQENEPSAPRHRRSQSSPATRRRMHGRCRPDV